MIMNQRLFELARKADPDFTGVYDDEMGHALIGPEAIEKFAKLIIEDYEKLLPIMCPWADADKEGPMKGWHVQFVARKHFGIEE